MYATVVLWGGAGVRRANVGSRDVNWWAWLIDDSDMSLLLSFGYKVHKAAEATSHHSMPSLTSAAAGRQTLQQTT